MFRFGREDINIFSNALRSPEKNISPKQVLDLLIDMDRQVYGELCTNLLHQRPLYVVANIFFW
jgi:hypothetical protein